MGGLGGSVRFRRLHRVPRALSDLSLHGMTGTGRIKQPYLALRKGYLDTLGLQRIEHRQVGPVEQVVVALGGDPDAYPQADTAVAERLDTDLRRRLPAR